MELAAYCDRIDYHGPQTADLPTLSALHRLHPQFIAFENLDPYLGRYAPLTIDSVWQKIISRRRGGWCFEHNTLFAEVLKAFGFDVSFIGARVLWMQPEDTQTPRVHMALTVRLGQDLYLADVGFGGLTLTAPLKIIANESQQTPHESFRLVEAGDGFQLEALLGGNWAAVYRFDLRQQLAADYEVCNYYLSTHEQSPFRSRVLAARTTPDGRLALLNNRLTFRSAVSGNWQKELRSSDELADVLENSFKINVPPGDLQKVADRLL